jgi:hypothetical protein
MGAQTSAPISLESFEKLDGPELVFSGVEQAGPSFEGRVFLNRPDADEGTATTPEAGYAGSFHVYGYGEHPPPGLADEQARRGAGGAPVAPIEKRVRPDEAALRGALERSGQLTVTVVPVPADPGGEVPEQPFQDVEIVVGRG